MQQTLLHDLVGAEGPLLALAFTGPGKSSRPGFPRLQFGELSRVDRERPFLSGKRRLLSLFIARFVY